MSVENAARRIRDRQLRFLPVCKPDGRVIGVVTERDIVVRAVAAGRAPELCSVDEIMTRNPPIDGVASSVIVDAAGRLVATVGQSILDGATSHTRAFRQPPPATDAARV